MAKGDEEEEIREMKEEERKKFRVMEARIGRETENEIRRS
jgi:plasmid stability protein